MLIESCWFPRPLQNVIDGNEQSASFWLGLSADGHLINSLTQVCEAFVDRVQAQIPAIQL